MSLFKHINCFNLFIGLYSSYIFLKAKNPNSLTGYLLLVITVISFGYFVYVQIKMRQPRMLKWLSILFYMFAIYGLIYIFLGETIYDYAGPIRQIDYLKKIAASLLPVYPFYYFASKGQFSIKCLNFWIPIFILLSIYSFTNYYNVLLTAAQEHGSSATEFTNNTGYLFVSLLPLIFLRKGNIILNYVYIGVCALFIVMGVKRGAIITGGLCIVYYIFNILRESKGYKKIVFIFLSIIAIGIAGYYISMFIENSSYFAYRLDNTLEGNMNGRDSIYDKMLDIFVNSNILHMLVGHGADSTIYFTTMLAHNDWLELLVNQGILGVTVYFCYFIVVYRTWRKYSKYPAIGLSLGGIFIVLFLKTLFSMSYTEYTLFLCMAYGYCMAYINNIETSRNHVKRA